MAEADHNSKRWGHLRKILERSGPFDTENFTPSPDNLTFLMNDCKILVIGKIRFVHLGVRPDQAILENALTHEIAWFLLNFQIAKTSTEN